MERVSLVLHEPRDEGEVLRFDEPWEGPFCGYATVIRDGDLFRLYYRGKAAATADGTGEVTCYAQSSDGLRWIKPKLGLHEVGGSRQNNVILVDAKVTHNFSPFLDTRPGVAADERYKALAGILYKNPGGGLLAMTSADGIHWRKLSDTPVITQGFLDSQNVSFWSQAEQRYVCYFRTFTEGFRTAVEWRPGGLRSVSRSTSTDFLRWTDPEPMRFVPRQEYHLYTSQTHPYFRAPHLYIATAVRFMPGRQAVSQDTAKHLGVDPAYFRAAGDATDSVLLTSRDGRTYDQTFRESLIRPGPRPSQWVSRSGYPALNVVPTGSAEMSIYVTQNYAQPTAHLHRYSLRLDGFASVHAGYDGGEFVTPPLTFEGNELSINLSTSAAGSVRVEIQDTEGQPIDGYTLADCPEIYGDAIERVVQWKRGADVSGLAGKPIRLRFALKDADLYAIRFVQTQGGQ